MLESLKHDALLSFLMDRSVLTHAQLDTILAAQIDGKLKEKVSYRDKGKLSAGAFVRTLRQGETNIEACMYTLILIEYLGLVQPEDLHKLSGLANLISKVRGSSVTRQEVDRLIVAVQDFAKGFSQRTVTAH